MKKQTKRVAAGVGAGVLTAAALAAAGAYLLSDKVRQRKAKAWVESMRRDVASKVKAARKMSEAEYKRLVDQASKRYGSMSSVNVAEARRVASDMKGEWQRLKKDAKVLAAIARGEKAAPGRKTSKASKARQAKTTRRRTARK